MRFELIRPNALARFTLMARMFLKQRDFARVRQDAAPLRKEREQYLTHLLNRGTSPQYVRAVAGKVRF